MTIELFNTTFAPSLALLQAQPQQSPWLSLAPFVFIFVIFWFLLIAPARKRQKAHQAMLEALKRGDKVLTNGGLYGKIAAIDDTVVQLEVSDKTKVRVAKSAIAGLEGEAPPLGGNR